MKAVQETTVTPDRISTREELYEVLVLLNDLDSYTSPDEIARFDFLPTILQKPDADQHRVMTPEEERTLAELEPLTDLLLGKCERLN